MVIPPFAIARLPHIEFGDGTFDRLPDAIRGYGKRVLLVTGGSSLDAAPQWPPLVNALQRHGIDWQRVRVRGEPSPELVDAIVAEHTGGGTEVVVGIGGGSVLDAAKAVAGLLTCGNSVMDHLEGVGAERAYVGPPLPFIAVPTTAGTGSEATKNAVLSKQGRDGFKKSFRDEQLVADVAIVDPTFLATCPAALIAANGMDALTQLMESYLSTRANPLTDALALSGIEAARDSLMACYQGGAKQSAARQGMAYASMLSGITLAQTGLGSVHGLASPLGAFFPIPHGVVCGTLVAAATRINIQALRQRDVDNPALTKYACLGALLAKRKVGTNEDAHEALLKVLEQWTEQLQLERLSAYGVVDTDLTHVVEHSRGSSMKTNPIVLTDTEIGQIVRMRL